MSKFALQIYYRTQKQLAQVRELYKTHYLPIQHHTINDSMA